MAGHRKRKKPPAPSRTLTKGELPRGMPVTEPINTEVVMVGSTFSKAKGKIMARGSF